MSESMNYQAYQDKINLFVSSGHEAMLSKLIREIINSNECLDIPDALWNSTVRTMEQSVYLRTMHPGTLKDILTKNRLSFALKKSNAESINYTYVAMLARNNVGLRRAIEKISITNMKPFDVRTPDVDKWIKHRDTSIGILPYPTETTKDSDFIVYLVCFILRAAKSREEELEIRKSWMSVMPDSMRAAFIVAYNKLVTDVMIERSYSKKAHTAGSSKRMKNRKEQEKINNAIRDVNTRVVETAQEIKQIKGELHRLSIENEDLKDQMSFMHGVYSEIIRSIKTVERVENKSHPLHGKVIGVIADEGKHSEYRKYMQDMGVACVMLPGFHKLSLLQAVADSDQIDIMVLFTDCMSHTHYRKIKPSGKSIVYAKGKNIRNLEEALEKAASISLVNV